MIRTSYWGLVLSMFCLVLVSLAAHSAGSAPLFFVGPEGIEGISARFPGAGTQQDPFVIAHLTIDAEGSDYGLWLENLAAWITVEGIEIYGAAESEAIGAIFIRNCEHVTIRNCYLHDNQIGILIERCSGLRVEDNLLENNMYGIVLGFLSRDHVITANRFDNVYNAEARSPNQWSDQGLGNCWSDLGDSTEYRITTSNIDYYASSLGNCPQPADVTSPVFYVPCEPIAVQLGASICDALAAQVSARDDRDGPVAWSSDCTDADSDAIGIRTIALSTCDAAGNCNQQEVQVLVQDQTPPQITLLGEDPLDLVDCAEYVDPGSQSIDAYCGPCEVSTRIDRTQDGYRVTYKSCDEYGNCAQAIRTVLLRDVSAPTITLLGSNPATVCAGEPYVDPGATAMDSCDGELLVSILQSTVDTTQPGSYVVEYQACDKAGHCTRVERVVEVIDTEPPTISLIGSDPDSVEAGQPYFDPGASAMDSADGDCAVSIDASALDTHDLGSLDIVYTSCDQAGNCTSIVRRVIREDTLPPDISLIGEQELVLEAGHAQADPGATAIDAWDGQIESVDSDWDTINFSMPNDYTATYSCCDSHGNCATRTRDVLVRDTIPPVIQLVGSDLLFVDMGGSLSDCTTGLLAVDAVDGDVTDRIERLTVGVDTSEVGIYMIEYIVSDRAGNCSDSFPRAVIVGLPPLGDSGEIDGITLTLRDMGVRDGSLIVHLEMGGTCTLSSYELALLVGDLLGTWMLKLPVSLMMAIAGDVMDASGRLLMEFQIAEEDVAFASEDPPVGFLQFASISYPKQMGERVEYDVASVQECVISAGALRFGDDRRLIVQVTPIMSGTRTIYHARISYAETLGPDVVSARTRMEADCLALSRIVTALLPEVSISISVYVDYYGLVYSGSYQADTPSSRTWETTYIHPALSQE